MAAIPDEYFTMETRPGTVYPASRLVANMQEVYRLPPQLKVKWLRADCVSSLDLSSNNSAYMWSLTAWQELALCMHAVPGLKELAVQLPRYPRTGVQVTSARQGAADVDLLRTRKCNDCETGLLHYCCQQCRCVAGAQSPHCGRAYLCHRFLC